MNAPFCRNFRLQCNTPWIVKRTTNDSGVFWGHIPGNWPVSTHCSLSWDRSHIKFWLIWRTDYNVTARKDISGVTFSLLFNIIKFVFSASNHRESFLMVVKFQIHWQYITICQIDEIDGLQCNSEVKNIPYMLQNIHPFPIYSLKK